MGGLRRRDNLHSKDPSVVTPFMPAPSEWGILRTTISANNLITRLLDGQRRGADRSAFLQRLDEQQGKQTAVEVESTGGSVAYREPVGPEASSGSLDAWDCASRQGLRHHPRVLASLEAWWACAREMCGGAEEVDAGQYLRIFKKVYCGMVAEYDEEEAVASVRDDWGHDSCGRASLTREMFFDCVFELADVWTKERTMSCTM